MRLRSRINYELLRRGINVRRLISTVSSPLGSTQWFHDDYLKLIQQRGTDTLFQLGTENPYLDDRFDQAGVMSGMYFHQDLLVARLIHLANPIRHMDIGSRTDGFVAHVASYRRIELIDIRPGTAQVTNISFQQADLMNLPDHLINSTDSISSLNVIEHFGLGRYGDPINYWGYLDALKNIAKILQCGGKFYFSVPIGPQRIEFNAHRVFSVNYLLDILTYDFEVESLSIVDDHGDLHENVNLDKESIDCNFGCYFGCGIFVLRKKLL
jgi:SAM-dependent methyltransferase